MQCSLVSFVSPVRIGFSFGLHPNRLDLSCTGNLFGHATLRGDFIILNLDGSYDNTSFAFVSYFNSKSESVKWYTRLSDVGNI